MSVLRYRSPESTIRVATVEPRPSCRATLIAATGYGQPKDRERAADAGFDCHFVKPVSVRDLVGILDERVVPSINSAAKTSISDG